MEMVASLVSTEFNMKRLCLTTVFVAKPVSIERSQVISGRHTLFLHDTLNLETALQISMRFLKFALKSRETG